MRKSEREIRERADILDVIARCQTVRLGLFSDDYPYIVPLSFGFEERDGRLTVYFHCAKEGKKTDLLARDSRICLEWDSLAGYVETGHSVTADYESVIAFGRAHRCEGEERVRGISLLLGHTGFPGYSARECAALPVVDVWRVDCEQVMGKRRFART